MSSDNPYDPFGFGGYTAEAMNRAGGDTSIVAGELRKRVESALESGTGDMTSALESVANDLALFGVYDFKTANDILDEIASALRLNSLEDPSARARVYLALASASDAIASQHISFYDLIRHREARTDPGDQIPGATRGRTLHFLDLAYDAAREVSREDSEKAIRLISVAEQAMNVAPDRVSEVLEEAREAALTDTDDMSILRSATLHAIAKVMLKVDIGRGVGMIDEAVTSAVGENYGSITSEELIKIADTVVELDLDRALAILSKAVRALQGRSGDDESKRVCRKLRRTVEKYGEQNSVYVRSLLAQVRDLEAELYGF
jgi:hypothetical protein